MHPKFPLVAATSFFLLWAPLTVAQTSQLRGVNQSGTARLPSAQQQLNQNLNRQQNNFSTQQRIDSANRLNRTQQINRNNSRTDTFSTCAGANLACRD